MEHPQGRIAQNLGIDRAARLIASAGETDNVNTRNMWEGSVLVRATTGAGANSTSITRNGVVLYEADSFGEHVRAFRFGAWCARLITDADKVEKELEEKRIYQEELKKREEDARFEAIDF